MERKVGRKEDDFWQYVDKKNGNKCKYCGHGIPGASRIKFHLAQITGEGIRICKNVPDDVKTAAAATLNNSNKRVKQSTAPNDLDEDNINSNLSSHTTRGKNIMEGKGGRKGDVFWQYVDEEKKCNYCGIQIPGASRIKFHLAQVTGGGIRPCNKVPVDIKSAAILALNSSNKRVEQSGTPSDFDENNINSNLLTSSTKGEIEVALLPTTDLVGWRFECYLDEIWEWLMRDDEMSIMGVWGMVGVGKSEMLKHIYNKLLNHKHRVIWVTVSQNYSIQQLQRAIAMSIDKNILESEDEVIVAARLLHEFKKMNKCVVILDDVWYDISLKDVGISLINNGIRIIVISRLLDVCKSMGCKHNTIKVASLDIYADEPFTLFLKSLGDDVTLSNDIKKIAINLTWQCGGLPLAIVTVARSMRGKADVREWRNALSKLRSPEMDYDDIKRCVFPKLKSSFDRLNDWTSQDCLLCLALCYQFESWKNRRELIRNFVDEGLINGKQGFEAQLDEGHSILNKLINNSLLEDETYGLRLHRLVWAMAINIGKENHGYMCKREFPDEQEWKEDLQKISLGSDKITEIPFAMSHRCPKLTTFRMFKNSCLKVIPDDFFTNMPALKILDLSYNRSIKVLPESISNLECLTVLLLAYCESLRHIPSLAKLRKLRRLDLDRTAITQVPLGFENLTNLRWLHLGRTAVMKAQDLERLQMLESIAATFVDRDQFIAWVRIIDARINSGLMKGYRLHLLGDAMDVHYYYYYNLNDIDNDKTVTIMSVEHSTLLLPTAIDVLKIGDCNQWKSLCDVFSIQQRNDLHISSFLVQCCDKLEYLFCSSDDCILCSSLQGLNELYLDRLDSLSMLCEENQMASSFLPFSHLKKLSISGCEGMKKLLTPGMSTQLHNLEVINVQLCESMEEIFSTGRSANYHDLGFRDELCSWLDIEPSEVGMDHTNAEAINLPNLKSVSLWCLPQLNSVYEGIIMCSSLQKFKIFGCPKLKCIPQTQPPFEIQYR